MFLDNEDAKINMLEHHGVKGMKWGVRREKRLAARTKKRFAYENKLQKARSQIKSTKDRAKFAKISMLYGTGAAESVLRKMAKHNISLDEAKDRYVAEKAGTISATIIASMAATKINELVNR